MESLLVLSSPVLIVEDDPLSLQRFSDVLLQIGYTDAQLFGVNTLAAARTLLPQHAWQLALVDFSLPDGNGDQLISELRHAYPDLPILVISAYRTEEVILAALRAGASGYLLKERDDLEVQFSIRNILAGGTPIDPFIARRLLQEFEQQEPTHKAETSLTEREQEVLAFIAQGLSNRKIGVAMDISTLTVDTHVKRIYRKLAVSSRVQAVRVAQESGILE